MMRIFILLMLTIQVSFGQSKAIDSLSNLLNNENLSERKLEILKNMVDEASNADIKLGLAYATQGVVLADQVADKDWQPRFYEMKGRMHANLVELDSASHYFSKAMNGYNVVGNKKGKATTWFKIGWVHKKKGELDKGMEADLSALKLMEEIGDKGGIAGAYSRLSDDLYNQGKYKEALDYASKTISFCEENNIKGELMYGYTAAGAASIALKQNENALNYFNKAINSAKSLGADIMTMCDFSNNRGNALKRLGRYKEALEAYKEAMSLARQANYTNAIPSLNANQGEVYLLMGNYEEALKYQLETVDYMEKIGDLSNMTENYGHVSTIYEKLSNYPMALEYQKKARKMHDSVAGIENSKTMSALLTKYEAEKKDATIALQGKQISQQKTIQWLSIGLVGLMTGLFFFGYRGYRTRTKMNKLLVAKNAENELLLKEIHHRVKNNLEVVSSLLALQSAQIDDPVTSAAMLEGQHRVQSIGIVHQKLYQGTNLGAIEMKDYFINLSESILDAFGAEKRVKIECAMDELNVDIDTAVPLGLIVNELLTNTLKYAFPGDQSGKVKIKLEKSKDGLLSLEVSDNGIVKTDIIKGSGFGGQLVQLLTKQLNGSVREDMQNGTSVYFEFKSLKVA